MKSDTAIVVFLVHGTFAPKAEWTRDGSRLRTAIRKEFDGCEIEFHAPTWLGFLGTRWNNGHRYRRVAADALSEQLSEIRKKRPSARIFVVGHSHGGNIALYAANNTEPGTVNGVISLGTPFFSVNPDFGSSKYISFLGRVLDNPLVSPWIAAGLAVVALIAALQTGAYVRSVLLSTLAPKWSIDAILMPVWGLLALAAFRAIHYGSVFWLSKLIIAIDALIERATGRAGQRALDRLSSKLPSEVPCRWITASSDEVERWLSGINATTICLRHGFQIVLWVGGSAVVLMLCTLAYEFPGQFDASAPWVERALLTFWTLILGSLATFAVLRALDLGFARILALVRSLPIVLGWEGLSTTLFTTLRVIWQPESHKDDPPVIQSKLEANSLCHSGHRYDLTDRVGWAHSLYDDEQVIADVKTTLRWFTTLPAVRCEACERLQRSQDNPPDSPSDYEMRGVDLLRDGIPSSSSYPVHRL